MGHEHESLKYIYSELVNVYLSWLAECTCLLPETFKNGQVQKTISIFYIPMQSSWSRCLHRLPLGWARR